MRWLALLLLVLALAGRAAAQDGGVRIRVTVDPTEGAMIGQHIRLFVDVLFPDDMPHPPKVAAPEVPGAQLFRFESQATTMNDRLDGRSYVGQRFEFALYPRRGGDLAVPAFVATLLDRAGDPMGSARSDPASVAVAVPPGIDASQPVVASAEVTAEEQWTPDPDGSFKVGDALKRSVTRTAADVPGLALAALNPAAPDGVRAYADPPEIADSVDRGEITGRRTDRVTYVFERPGTYLLPEALQSWWDLDHGAARTAQEPGVEVVVQAGEAAAAAAATPDAGGRRPLPLIAGAVLALLAAGILFYRNRTAAVAWLRLRREAREDREPAVFRGLLQTCRTGDAAATYRLLQAWLPRLPGRPRLASLARSGGRADLVPLFLQLERALFAPHREAWAPEDGRAFARSLAACRHGRRASCPSVRPALPGLNPGR
ncbi:protein BatD [Mycobacterium sp. KBS0706]|uniref:BatD family protein n=1 Tax=Mycobacterium sp. KBS0706 TaxID=2578109 RepID=UPI00110FB7F4|nr:BatD family protein [Mycobacterium sp. KBS0706]TSD83759.1 protein BatD [Mycobacterium sp. KBS0706]